MPPSGSRGSTDGRDRREWTARRRVQTGCAAAAAGTAVRAGGSPRVLAAILALKKPLLCRICSNFLQDTYTVTECGHQFCRLCIYDYVGKQAACPTCSLPARVGRLVKNPKSDVLVACLQKLMRLYSGKHSECGVKPDVIVSPGVPERSHKRHMGEQQDASEVEGGPSEDAAPEVEGRPSEDAAPGVEGGDFEPRKRTRLEQAAKAMSATTPARCVSPGDDRLADDARVSEPAPAAGPLGITPPTNKKRPRPPQPCSPAKAGGGTAAGAAGGDIFEDAVGELAGGRSLVHLMAAMEEDAKAKIMKKLDLLAEQQREQNRIRLLELQAKERQFEAEMKDREAERAFKLAQENLAMASKLLDKGATLLELRELKLL